MENKNELEQKVNETNLKLNEQLNDGDIVSFASGGKEANSVADANMKIQQAHDSDYEQDGILPTYMYNNTPAIKINRKK
jgi:hypothetical protein